MERGLKGKGPVSTDPILSHSPTKSQEPPARAGGLADLLNVGNVRRWDILNVNGPH